MSHAPEFWAYNLMAENEKARGDMKRWKESLEDYLAQGADTGLEFAKAKVAIADYHMSLGQWSKAQPYAEEAATTWAGWAMACAGKCYEGMGEYERAEYWCRNNSERYPNAFMEWFDFCKRTGRGDVASAARFEMGVVKGSGQDLSEYDKTQAILFFDLTNDPEQGVAFLRPLLEKALPAGERSKARYARWIERFFLAHFADSVNETKLRDECWAQIGNDDEPAAAELAAAFQKSLQLKDGKTINTSTKSTDKQNQAFLDYFTGCFLAKHGTAKDAVSFFELSQTESPPGNSYVPLLGRNAIRAVVYGKIPDDPHLYLLRGFYHRSEEQLDLALKDLDESIRLDPRSTDALRLRGSVRRAMSDLEGSVSDYTTLMKLDANDPYAYAGRAVTYLLQEKDAEAAKDIEQGIAAKPDNGLIHGVKGLLSLVLGKNKEAEELFDKAVSMDRSVGAPLEQHKKTVRKKRGIKAPDVNKQDREASYPSSRGTVMAAG